MQPLTLFACSYKCDMKRAIRLALSIQEYNVDHLPFWMAVPYQDLAEFQKNMSNCGIQWICQEEIFEQSPSSQVAKYANFPGGFIQQLIKAEVWRMGIGANLLVLDSDCQFLRRFQMKDFFDTDGTPYTVTFEGGELFDFADQFKLLRVKSDWLNTMKRIRTFFGNTENPMYTHGAAPFLWSSSVWADLAARILEPAGITLIDLLQELRSEFIIYGEALRVLRTIPIRPHNEFFKCYHYEQQLWHDQLNQVTEHELRKEYLGVVYQSNWQYWLDHEIGDSIPSQISKRTRRSIRWLRWRWREFEISRKKD